MPDDPRPGTRVFILNPTAGRHLYAEVQARIRSAPWKSDRDEIHLTERPGHATDLARDAAQRLGADALVFACGGDGTVNEVVNGLVGTPAALGVLPIGTGNDFVKSLYRERSAFAILDRLPEALFRRIDVGRMNGRCFVNVASLGFDTEVGNYAKRMVARRPWLGGFSYLLAVFACLSGNRVFHMECELEGEDPDGRPVSFRGARDFTLAAVCNGGYYGGGFHPAPGASLEDGLLDVCLVDRKTVPQILGLVPKYRNGTHLDGRPGIHMVRTRSGVFRKRELPLNLNCDGESGEADEIVFEILPGALTLACY